MERCINGFRATRGLPAFLPFITCERIRFRSAAPISDPETNWTCMVGLGWCLSWSYECEAEKGTRSVRSQSQNADAGERTLKEVPRRISMMRPRFMFLRRAWGSCGGLWHSISAYSNRLPMSDWLPSAWYGLYECANRRLAGRATDDHDRGVGLKRDLENWSVEMVKSVMSEMLDFSDGS